MKRYMIHTAAVMLIIIWYFSRSWMRDFYPHISQLDLCLYPSQEARQFGRTSMERVFVVLTYCIMYYMLERATTQLYYYDPLFRVKVIWSRALAVEYETSELTIRAEFLILHDRWPFTFWVRFCAPAFNSIHVRMQPYSVRSGQS